MEDQISNQLTNEEVRQILDLTESVFFESTNGKEEERKINGSISCSSNSFSEMPSEMEQCPDQALITDFPHNDFHCQQFHHTESNIMLETTFEEVVGCSLLNRLDHETGCEDSEMDTIPQDILNIINPEKTNIEGFIGCTTKSNNLILHQDDNRARCQEVEIVPVKVPKLCSVCQAEALKYSSYGGKVCSSCRAFFRRSVQSGYHALFECKVDQNCNIQHQIQRKCQFCRFQSCQSSGMKLNLVLNDKERH